jgi:hypothetical protein
MTQYPPNYQPPPQQPPHPGYQNYYYQPPPDPLAPAKRASILMFVLGGLSLCCGMCIGIFAFIPWQQIVASSPDLAQMQSEFDKLPFTPNMLFAIMAVIALAPGVLYIILGLFLRKGSMIAAITSIVLTLLWVLMCLLSIVTSFARLGAGRMSSAGGGNACVVFVCLALAILLLVWLVQAVKAISNLSLTTSQYQQQYWQYQQGNQMPPIAMPGQQQPPMPPPPTFDNNSPNPPPPPTA